MAKSTTALLTGRIQMCKTNPSIAHIGLATHGRSIQTVLMLGVDYPEFFDCCFQRRRLIGCFDDSNERAGRSLNGAVNFPLDGLLGHG